MVFEVRWVYLGARFYDPSTGRFNRLDDFAGNNDDPQSLHKYLYANGDPIQGVDPSGLLTLRSTLATIGGIAALGLSPIWVPGLYGRFLASWGIPVTQQPKKIAIVEGTLGGTVDMNLMNSAVSLTQFKQQLSTAGHIVTSSTNPDEQGLINLLNTHDIVIALGHGPIAAVDSNGLALGAIKLGGTGVHSRERTVYKWVGGGPSPVGQTLNKGFITANELSGRVNNSDLVFVVPGCNSAKTDRLFRASGASLFVGCNKQTNGANVAQVLEWVVDYLANGEKVATSNFTSKSQSNVVNPKNSGF